MTTDVTVQTHLTVSFGGAPCAHAMVALAAPNLQVVATDGEGRAVLEMAPGVHEVQVEWRGVEYRSGLRADSKMIRLDLATAQSVPGASDGHGDAPSSGSMPALDPDDAAARDPRRAIAAGRYQLESYLGRDEVGEIFLARDGERQRTAVIRLLSTELRRHPEAAQAVLADARMAATLGHPNIVPVYDCGFTDGEYFIAMEHVRGHNLLEVVQAGARVGFPKPPLEHALSIVMGVCAALQHGHEKSAVKGRPLGLAHRSLTPQHILVTVAGGVQVNEFGLTRSVPRVLAMRASTLRGKIGYLSPEQCRGTVTDARADLFALGVILHELTTGERLYQEGSNAATLKKIVEAPVPAPRDHFPFYPPVLDAVVARCLAKSPNHRYQSAGQLLADLEKFAREHQLQTGPAPLQAYLERLYPDEVAVARPTPPLQATTPPRWTPPPRLTSAPPTATPMAAPMVASAHPPIAEPPPPAPLLASPSSFAELGDGFEPGMLKKPLLGVRLSPALKMVGPVAAIVVLALGVGLVWKVRPDPGPATSAPAATQSAPIATPPATAPAPEPVPAAPSTAVANRLGATPGTPPSALPAPGAPSGTAPAVGAPLRGALKWKPVQRVGAASISITAEPRCEVLIDGVPYGATPLSAVAVPVGRHLITLLNSVAGIRQSQRLMLAAGETWSHAFTFPDGKIASGSGATARQPAVEASKSEAGGPRAPAATPTTGLEGKREAPPEPRPKAVEGPAASGPVSTTPAMRSSTAGLPVKPPVKPKNVGAHMLDGQELFHPDPHLPEVVKTQRHGTGEAMFTGKICVDTYGKVFQVNVLHGIPGADEKIVETMRNWTYRPQPVSVCFLANIVFDIK